MSILSKRIDIAFVLCILCGLLAACSATTRNISPTEELHYDAGYDFSDKKIIVAKLVASLLSKPPLGYSTDRPVVIVYGVTNRTSEHISTNAITDDIRKDLINSGKVRFVNETQRNNIMNELDYQHNSGMVSNETRIAKARQIGAKFMLTGNLYSIEKDEPKQFRLKKKELKYYSLNLELTDIESSIIEWADSVEVIREASKPFIGW
ncbi:MAG: penicillin-binding protein activator LpoB [Desulfobacterales bacterium]|nr:penicillin-binding protein activator LpoB [Desulfobacterales bacterium]